MSNLTPEERRVVLFLLAVVLLSSGINFLLKMNSSLKPIFSPDENSVKINLNTADKELLITLPGIGEKLAQRIIEYRIRQQFFSAKEELKNIKGISPSRYEKIKAYLTLQ